MNKRALIWFTKDLRIEDNAIINWAVENNYDVMALAFEQKHKSYRQNEYHLESVDELKNKFKQKDISFHISKGLPEEEILKWVKCNKIDLVLTLNPFNSREKAVVSKLTAAPDSIPVKTFYYQTLIDVESLPFPVSELPFVFTNYRKIVENACTIPQPLVTNFAKLTGFPAVIPEDSHLSQWFAKSEKISYPFDMIPGEMSSWRRLHEFFSKSSAISNYKETRNGLLAKNDSSKFSAGLACGTISARSIYHELIKYETMFGVNESTKWFKMELMWRDYFKFLALRIGARLFSLNGISQKNKYWENETKIFDNWCNGKTGLDFVDANMIELKHTGWMSNRGRQNVASYLSKHVNFDWTQGAKYFESHLLDDDTESNWGNWLYISGVGTDPRDRLFNIERQAEMYDPESLYRKKWLSFTKNS